MLPPHPLRVRVHGGRTTHAARELPTSSGPDHLTACDHYLHHSYTHHWLPDTAAVTCRRCIRALNRQEHA